MQNFWKKLNKPFVCLAPMADITDVAFREILAKYGKPDVMWTEFVSCDGLCSVGKNNILPDLKYFNKERPIVVQIFGSKPDNMTKTARLIKKMGFDGIDINMGCPDRSIEKQGAGAALMKNPALAKELILAVKKGADGLPVSVKTRLGYNHIDTKHWVENLLSAQPAVITLHLRTRKEMSKAEPHWDEIKIAVQLAKKTNTLIIANGDIKSIAQAKAMAEKYSLAGTMIGRAAIGNPWVFNQNNFDIDLPKKIKVMLEHAKLFEKYNKNKKKFLIMRKHMNAYLKGMDNMKPLRMELMKTTNFKEAKQKIKDYFNHNAVLF